MWAFIRSCYAFDRDSIDIESMDVPHQLKIDNLESILKVHMPPACTYWNSEAALCLYESKELRRISMSAPSRKQRKKMDPKRELKSPKTASMILLHVTSTFGAHNFSTILAVLTPFIDMIRCPAALALKVTQ